MVKALVGLQGIQFTQRHLRPVHVLINLRDPLKTRKGGYQVPAHPDRLISMLSLLCVAEQYVQALLSATLQLQSTWEEGTLC